MAMATEARPKAAQAFNVACPCCGTTDDGAVTIELNDLTALRCSVCDEMFTAAQAVARAREQLRRWEAVARWVSLSGECLADVPADDGE